MAQNYKKSAIIFLKWVVIWKMELEWKCVGTWSSTEGSVGKNKLSHVSGWGIFGVQTKSGVDKENMHAATAFLCIYIYSNSNHTVMPDMTHFTWASACKKINSHFLAKARCSLARFSCKTQLHSMREQSSNVFFVVDYRINVVYQWMNLYCHAQYSGVAFYETLTGLTWRHLIWTGAEIHNSPLVVLMSWRPAHLSLKVTSHVNWPIGRRHFQKHFKWLLIDELNVNVEG